MEDVPWEEKKHLCYGIDFLLHLSKSPLAERPERLAPNVDWMGAEALRPERGMRRQNSEQSDRVARAPREEVKFTPRVSKAEDIVLGPPKLAFASSSTTSRYVRADRIGEDGYARGTTEEVEGSGKSVRNQAGREKNGRGPRQPQGPREEEEGWVPVARTPRKSFGAEDKERPRGERGASFRDKERVEPREREYRIEREPRGPREYTRERRRSNNGDNKYAGNNDEPNWRSAREGQSDSKYRRNEPEWMDEPVDVTEGSMPAHHSAQEFQAWKEAMKAKQRGDAPSQHPDEQRPLDTPARESASAGTNSFGDLGFFGGMGEPTKPGSMLSLNEPAMTPSLGKASVSRPPGFPESEFAAPTPSMTAAVPATGRASRFTRFFGAPVAQEAPSPVVSAASPAAPSAPALNPFENLLNASLQRAEPEAASSRPPPGFGGSAAAPAPGHTGKPSEDVAGFNRIMQMLGASKPAQSPQMQHRQPVQQEQREQRKQRKQRSSDQPAQSPVFADPAIMSAGRDVGPQRGAPGHPEPVDPKSKQDFFMSLMSGPPKQHAAAPPPGFGGQPTPQQRPISPVKEAPRGPFHDAPIPPSPFRQQSRLQQRRQDMESPAVRHEQLAARGEPEQHSQQPLQRQFMPPPPGFIPEGMGPMPPFMRDGPPGVPGPMGPLPPGMNFNGPPPPMGFPGAPFSPPIPGQQMPFPFPPGQVPPGRIPEGFPMPPPGMFSPGMMSPVGIASPVSLASPPPMGAFPAPGFPFGVPPPHMMKQMEERRHAGKQ
ncbi:hypothetical protein G7K_5617-t1 [Saitoella complicata NRRL Y-17804]|uniref:Uncharacterized protein n=2 Tax=Saitoella complicata (strain BCRC 22490 / CBS 7301 / JCM 7358 / NBRC 10748 / NRRL Y-17804) TaxID=698492 RepID=A0A0E9NNZ0_SAICN|nr:hypothetical protein G7K_5617-t1 [Saitoella complicata NRRL Y-17804]